MGAGNGAGVNEGGGEIVGALADGGVKGFVGAAGAAGPMSRVGAGEGVDLPEPGALELGNELDDGGNGVDGELDGELGDELDAGGDELAPARGTKNSLELEGVLALGLGTTSCRKVRLFTGAGSELFKRAFSARSESSCCSITRYSPSNS